MEFWLRGLVSLLFYVVSTLVGDMTVFLKTICVFFVLVKTGWFVVRLNETDYVQTDVFYFQPALVRSCRKLFITKFNFYGSDYF